MSEHQKESAFLRHSILCDDTNEHIALQERFEQLQHHESRLHRIMSMMLVFTALGGAGLAYGLLLEDGALYKEFRFAVRILCDLGMASLIGLVGCAALWVVYRKRSNKLREECRQLIARLLESHQGKPNTAVHHEVSPDEKQSIRDD